MALGVALLSMLCAVAYVLNLQPTSREDLTIVRFTSYPGFESAPSFSPDGNEIVFSWYQDNEFSTAIGFGLYVKQFGNERAVRLTNHEANYIIPAWSPDGQNIAFTMIGKNGNGVYLMPALGGPERRIAEFDETSYETYQWFLLSWSADSRRIAFSKADPRSPGTYRGTEHHHIHLVDVQTGEERVLPDPSPDCTENMDPAFSPDRQISGLSVSRQAGE